MKKYIIYILIAVGIGGFYLYDKIKKNNLHTEICRDFFKVTTEMSECKKEPNDYMILLSKKEAEKIIDKYMIRLKEMENIILEHNESLVPLDAARYKYLSPNKIYSKYIRQKFYNKKIVVGGSKRDCQFQRTQKGYFFCLKQETTDFDTDKTSENSIKVEIANIDSLNDHSKEIFDEFDKAFFDFFEVTVYGELIEIDGSLYSVASMNADQIIFEIGKYTRKQMIRRLKWVLYRSRLSDFEEYLKKKKKV